MQQSERHSPRRHFSYSNVMSTLAVFLVIAGGTALAAALPRDSVTSKTVKDNSLSSKDLKDGKAVTGAEVADESLNYADIANGGLYEADIAPNSLTGTAIVESQLGQVPAATLGGLGRSARGADNCDPDSTTFLTCVSVGPIFLPTQTRVLLIGALRAGSEVNARGVGTCRLGTSATDGLAGTNVLANANPDSNGVGFGLTAVTPLLGPGAISFGIDCNEQADFIPIVYNDIMLSAVLLSPG